MQLLSPSGELPPVLGPSHSMAPLVGLKVPLEGVAARPRAASTTAIATASPNRAPCRRRIRVSPFLHAGGRESGDRRRQTRGRGQRRGRTFGHLVIWSSG